MNGRKAKFNKVNQGETRFFQFGEKKDGNQLMAKFVRVLPEDHHLTGIEFEEMEETKDGYKSKGIVTVPSYNQLVNFFDSEEQNENFLYLIELTGEKDLKGGRKVFIFDVSKADLSEEA